MSNSNPGGVLEGRPEPLALIRKALEEPDGCVNRKEHDYYPCGCIGPAALSALDELEKSTATLRAELLNVHDALHRGCYGKADLPAEIRALRAERDALRAQLDDENRPSPDCCEAAEKAEAELSEVRAQLEASRARCVCGEYHSAPAAPPLEPPARDGGESFLAILRSIHADPRVIAAAEEAVREMRAAEPRPEGAPRPTARAWNATTGRFEPPIVNAAGTATPSPSTPAEPAEPDPDAALVAESEAARKRRDAARQRDDEEAAAAAEWSDE